MCAINPDTSVPFIETSAPPEEGSLGGKKVKKESSKKNCCCLKAAWKAIKNFFRWLCCCCSSRRIDRSDDSMRTVLSDTVIEPPISSNTAHQNPITNSLNIPPSAVVLGPELKEAEKVEEERVFLYPPLRQLNEQRKQEFRPFKLPLIKQPPLPQPEGYAELDAFKKNLINPKLPPFGLGRKQKFEEFKTNFFQTHATYLKEIAAKDKESDRKGIEHPSQIPLLLDFCKGRFDQINTELQNNKLEQFNVDDLPEYNALKRIEPLWLTLTEIAQKGQLDTEELNQLETCSQQLSPSAEAFYTDFPAIANNLRAVVNLIERKLVVAKNAREQLTTINIQFANTLCISFFPSTPQKLLDRYQREFFEQLKASILQLFQISDKDPNTIELKPSHIEEIFGYLADEIEKFNNSLKVFCTQHADLELEFQPLDPQFCRQEAIKDIAPLLEAWKMMQEMLVGQSGIDAAICLLFDSVNLLPVQDSELWGRYPLLKQAMESTLALLATNDFGNYEFEVNDARDPQKYASDQKKEDKIESALEMMAQKLGCVKPERQKVMDVSNDEYLRNLHNQQVVANYAAELNAIYNAYLQFGQQFAVQQIAVNIRQNFPRAATHAEEQSFVHQVLQHMPQDRAQSVISYLRQNF